MTLNEARAGDSVIIGDIGWPEKEKANRLYDLGLIPGSEAEVIAIHPFHGPIVLKSGGATVAIGRGLARRIPVKISHSRSRPSEPEPLSEQ